MSDRDPNDESTEDPWDELEGFSGAETETETETETESEEFVELEEVTDVESAARSPTETGVDEPASTPIDDGSADIDDTPDAEEVFDEMDVSAVDGEALWDELADAETEAESFGASEATGEVGEPIDTGTTEPSGGRRGDRSAGDSDSDTGGETETLVDKRAYCQQCPYFSAPPAVSCSHAGTEIVEVLKDGRFRVRNCPVVTETGPDRTILNDGP